MSKEDKTLESTMKTLKVKNIQQMEFDATKYIKNSQQNQEQVLTRY